MAADPALALLRNRHRQASRLRKLERVTDKPISLLWLDQQDEAELQVQIAERKAPAVAAIASAPVRQTRKTLQFATVKKGIKKGIEMTLTNVVALTNWHPADALADVGAEIKTLQAREAVLRAALLKGSSSLAGTTTTVYTGTAIGQDSFNWKTVTLM